MITNTLPYAEIGALNNYRLYLRHSFYPAHSGKLIELLYANIPAILDIHHDDSCSMFIIRLRKRKSYNVEEYYQCVEKSLLELYKLAKINAKVYSDSFIAPYIKNQYINLQNNIENLMTGYIRYMYSVTVAESTIYLYI